VVIVGVATSTKVSTGAIEELQEVFHDDGHVFRAFTPQTGSGSIEDSHAERLSAALTFGDTEFHTRSRFDDVSGFQRRGVQKDFLTLIRVDEAEAFVMVIKLDLAGGHVDAFLSVTRRNLASGRIPPIEPRYPGSVTSPANFEPSAAERLLAAMIVGVIALSILAFFAIIVGTWQGMDSAAFSAGLWPAITMTPLFGLPIGFVLIISLLVISTRRRRAQGTDDASE